jgi:hypothetical protein
MHPHYQMYYVVYIIKCISINRYITYCTLSNVSPLIDILRSVHYQMDPHYQMDHVSIGKRYNYVVETVELYVLFHTSLSNGSHTRREALRLRSRNSRIVCSISHFVIKCIFHYQTDYVPVGKRYVVESCVLFHTLLSNGLHIRRETLRLRNRNSRIVFTISHFVIKYITIIRCITYCVAKEPLAGNYYDIYSSDNVH